MRGSLTKYRLAGTKKQRWRYRIYTGHDAAGQKIYEGRAGFTHERDAADAMRAHILDLQKTTSPAPPTLGEWLADWTEHYAPHRCKSLKTLERYRELITYVVAGPSELLVQLSNRPLPCITHAELEPALTSLVGARGKRRQLSVRLVRHVAGVVSVAMRKAFALNLISSNPMLKVELPRVPRKSARGLTPFEIQAVREVCREDWTFVLIELALSTGCRRGELLALEWSDLDWEKRSVCVNKSLEQTRLGLRIKATKTESPRTCTLPTAAVDALRHEYQNSNERQLIFCNSNGGYLKPDLVSQVVVRRLRRAGIKNASLHTLRHTHASNLLSRGVPLPAVSARLGHADSQITARVYSHVLPGDDQRAADVWDIVLGHTLDSNG